MKARAEMCELSELSELSLLLFPGRTSPGRRWQKRIPAAAFASRQVPACQPTRLSSGTVRGLSREWTAAVVHGFEKKCAKSAISAKSLLIACRVADPSSVFHLVRPVTKGTIIPPRRQVLMNAPFTSGVRVIWLRMASGWCPVVWCFQVVKTAQSRGRTERTLFYTLISALRRRALAGRRNAAERRNPSLSHCCFATPKSSR
jgi:hypothetical protein